MKQIFKKKMRFIRTQDPIMENYVRDYLREHEYNYSAYVDYYSEAGELTFVFDAWDLEYLLMMLRFNYQASKTTGYMVYSE